MDRSDIVAADKAHLWHPYTAMGTYIAETDPLVIARAQGAYLEDVNGKRYLDANGSWWVSALGHQHPRLVAALKAQADELCHVALAGITHRPAAELAERLVASAPTGLTRVFFSDDGSTAIECAVKLAVQYWHQMGKPEKANFVALDAGFHGESVGAASLGGVEVFRKPVQSILFRCQFAKPPLVQNEGKDVAEALRALEELLSNEHESIAAMVLEPRVQGAAGMNIYSDEFLRGVRELTSRYQVLLVADEVFVGMGRTGSLWACEGAGISPDLLCSAKGLTGGLLPFAATLVTEELFEGFLGERDRAFYYGHSFCGNPLGARVALEALRVMDEEEVLAGIPERNQRLTRCIQELCAALSRTSCPRSLGMVAALDLAPDPDPFLAADEAGYLAEVGWQVYERALAKGAYLRPLGNVIYTCPALNIPMEDLERLCDIIAESVMAVMG